ncbi:MAG TPA: hypothetical protein VGJ00_03675 [Rhabdochlamydiaceae bacterium]|jgi:hypothetical protein
MDNLFEYTFTWTQKTDEKFSPVKLSKELEAWQESTKVTPVPPKDFIEFRDRVSEFLEKLYERYFGVSFFVTIQVPPAARPE